MRQFDLVIFDLDGTLVDSKADIVFCVNATLMKFGMEALDEEVISRHVGTGVRPLLAAVLAKTPDISRQEVIREFELCYETHLTDQTRLYRGLEQVLDQCTAKITILTNKMQRFADKIVDQLQIRHHFVGVYGREAFARCKPDPMPVLEICRIHQIDVAKTIIIGDTDADILSGQGAGVYTCAVLYGFGDKASLYAAKPDRAIHLPSDLVSLLK